MGIRTFTSGVMDVQQDACCIINGRITIAVIVSSGSCNVTLKVPYGVKNSFGIYTIWCCLLP